MKLMRLFVFILISLFLFGVTLSQNINAAESELDKLKANYEKEQAELKKQQEELQKKINKKVEEARSLMKEANDYQGKGDYDNAYETAKKIKAIKAEVDDLNDQLAKAKAKEEENRVAYLKAQKNLMAKLKKAKSKAEKQIKKAKSLISKAESMEADKLAPQLLANAKSSLLSAENSFEQEVYNESYDYASASVKHAQAAIAKIEDIRRKEEEARLAALAEIPTGPMLFVKGKYLIRTNYSVRLIPERRDCLWRIAEYEFIYNNPWKWTVIYQANKEQIKDPDLIYPGQKFDVPALDENGNPLLAADKESLKKKFNIQSKEAKDADVDSSYKDVPANAGRN